MIRQDQHWRLDKRIPLMPIVTFVAAILIQSAAAYSWGIGMSFRVEQLEKQALLTAPQGDRLTRLEVKFDTLIDAVNEVKAILRQPTPIAR